MVPMVPVLDPLDVELQMSGSSRAAAGSASGSDPPSRAVFPAPTGVVSNIGFPMSAYFALLNYSGT